jgi:hypothetical protein
MTEPHLNPSSTPPPVTEADIAWLRTLDVGYIIASKAAKRLAKITAALAARSNQEAMPDAAIDFGESVAHHEGVRLTCRNIAPGLTLHDLAQAFEAAKNEAKPGDEVAGNPSKWPELRQIVRVQHGSHLYGTNSETSDLDYKGVHVPSARAIILQRAENVLERGSKVSDGIKNSAEDVDDQSFSLQKFFGMLAVGDTVATEILFAPPAATLYAGPDWADIQAIGKTLLNRQCRGFVGYCRRQAAKYGIKGSRMAACKDIVELLAAALDKHGTVAKVELLAAELDTFCEMHEFSGVEIITSQAGTDVPHLEVVDRKIPFTASIKTALEVYAKVYENYGGRARAAMHNEGIDWKAVSHAVRVARQAVELLTTGRITFPRPDAAELLAIKQGVVSYSLVSEQLEALVARVEEVALTSPLPEKSDHRLIDETVLRYYGTAIAAATNRHTLLVALPHQ